MRGDCSKENKEDNERKDEANKHTHNTYIEVKNTWYTLNEKNKEGIEGGREGPKLIKRKERKNKQLKVKIKEHTHTTDLNNNSQAQSLDLYRGW